MAQSLSSAAEHASISNSAARADTIRRAVQQQAQLEAQVDAVNAEIREFKSRVIKGDLGFKLSDWNAIYRVSQLEIEDRDTLLETIREGFAALHIGGVMDWVAAAETASRRNGNGRAAPDDVARAAGRQDGLGGVEAERERVMALGDEQPPKRRGRPPGSRNRPKPQVEPWDEGAEF